MMVHPNQNQRNQGLRPDGTPCTVKCWQFAFFRRKKKRRRNHNSGDDNELDDADGAASVSLYPEYCQRSNEEDAFLEIAQDFGDLVGEQHRLPPPPPGFQVSSDHGGPDVLRRRVGLNSTADLGGACNIQELNGHCIDGKFSLALFGMTRIASFRQKCALKIDLFGKCGNHGNSRVIFRQQMIL